MKKLRHILDDGPVIELAVPSCLHDCPYCHGLSCHKTAGGKRDFSPQEKSKLETGGYPAWCPLENETLEEEMARKHRQEQELHRV